MKRKLIVLEAGRDPNFLNLFSIFYVNEGKQERRECRALIVK